MMLIGLLLPIAVAGLVVLIWSIRVYQEYERGVFFRLGRLGGVRGPGLFLIAPLIDRVVKIDTRILTVQLDTQETITRDGVAVKVNAVLWFRPSDPVKVVTTVIAWRATVVQAAETALRDAIGQSDLDQMLKDRTAINGRLLGLLSEAAAKWGVAIEGVEMKDLDIPEQMQRAIAREAEAIREKRARIIKAEGESEAARKLAEAANVIGSSPGALELRRLQTMAEIGAEHNSTIVAMMPVELIEALRSLADRPAP